jgi:aryl-alcohol dehydrogenase-like predicted oxidoreductase
VHGLLIHHPGDLDGKAGSAVWSAMREIRESGRAAKLGVSVYARDELDAVLDRFEPDLVQLPLSLLDQRALRDGTIDELRARGIEIHARSLFLQGLIFLPIESLDHYFAPIAAHLSDLHQAIGKAGSTPLAAALDFGCRSGVDRIVVGVQTVSHLEECLAALETESDIDYSRFAIDDPRFVEPRRWNLK